MIYPHWNAIQEHIAQALKEASHASRPRWASGLPSYAVQASLATAGIAGAIGVGPSTSVPTDHMAMLSAAFAGRS